MKVRELIPRRAPAVTPIQLVISIDGQTQATLGRDDLCRFEASKQVSDFHCVTTWSNRGLHWAGVNVRGVLHCGL